MAGLVQRALGLVGLTPQSEAIRLRSQVDRLLADKAQASGVPMSFGQFQIENNKALSTSKKYEIFEDMESDPHVKGALRANQLPLINAEWQIQAASDKPRDVEIAEFVGANLMRQPSERFGREYWSKTTWRQRLTEILSMQQYGFSLFSVSAKPVGTKQVIERVHWMEPSSVDPSGWVLDDEDRLVRVLRTYKDGRDHYRYREALEADQLALYVWDLKGARYEGRPMLRSMYGAWLRKQFVQKMGAILAQKLGSPAVLASYPSSGWDDADVDAFVKFVRSSRNMEAAAEAFFVSKMSSDGQSAKLEYAGAQHNVDRGLPDLIQNENMEISHAASNKSHMLGETESGSRSLGESQSSREMDQIEATVGLVCEFEQQGCGSVPGIIQRLVDANYLNVMEYPQLTASKIGGIEPAEHQAVVACVGAGIIPNTPELRQQVTERLGYSLPDDAYEIQNEMQPSPNDDEPTQTEESAEETADSEQSDSTDMDETRTGAAALSDRILAAGGRFADLLEPLQKGRPKDGHRYPNRLETEYVNLAAVQRTFRVGERDLLSFYRGLRLDMHDELFQLIRDGRLNQRNVNGLRRMAYKGALRATARLRKILTGIAQDGAAHAVQEIVAQFTTGPHKIEAAAERYVDVIGEQVRVRASMDVGAVWNRLLSEMLDQFASLTARNLPAAEMERELTGFVEGLSQKPIDQRARHGATTAYNVGRSAEIKTAADEGVAEYAVRSEILDGNTCSACRNLDGLVMKIDDPDFDRLMPPAECLGGDNCRGFAVALREEVAA